MSVVMSVVSYLSSFSVDWLLINNIVRINFWFFGGSKYRGKLDTVYLEKCLPCTLNSSNSWVCLWIANFPSVLHWFQTNALLYCLFHSFIFLETQEATAICLLFSWLDVNHLFFAIKTTFFFLFFQLALFHWHHHGYIIFLFLFFPFYLSFLLPGV